MNFTVSLPLKLSVSFYNWGQNSDNYLVLFKKIEKLNLFSLSFEFDQESLYQFNELKDKLSFKAFKKILAIDYSLFNEDLYKTGLFSEIEVSVPFDTDADSLNHFLKTRGSSVKAVNFLLTRENTNIFRIILSFSKRNNVKINIPNPNLIRYGKELLKVHLRAEDLKNLYELKESVRASRMEIHDYFLAKFFELPDAQKFQGCQAGRLLGHMENGMLYPCSSIPVAIGSLLEYDFEFLWKEAYNMVKDMADKCCIDCFCKKSCNLGCIGNALYLGSFKDPLCEV